MLGHLATLILRTDAAFLCPFCCHTFTGGPCSFAKVLQTSRGRLLLLTCLWSLPVFQDLDLASVFVSDAQYNRNIYFDTSPQAVR